MDIIISQDFFPKIGGAHLWLYEVYRRWPSKVNLLTTEYASYSDEASQQHDFDKLDHGSLEIIRGLTAIEIINLFDWRCLNQFYNNAKKISRLKKSKSIIFLHSLRAFPEGFLGLLFKKMHPNKSRLITYAHGEEILIAQTSRQIRLMTKLVYSGSDLVIANSNNTKNLVLDLCPTAKVICIHPGVNAAEFIQSDHDILAYRSKWEWSSDKLIVSTIARMEERKNHAMVIRAIGELKNEGIAVNYICGGDGQEKNNLIRIVNEMGLQQLVHFTGAVTDQEKKLIYGATDIYAMPSIQVGPMIEGFGIVFLEAAAAGKPSICGNIGGQSEAVRDGETGLVVDGSSLFDVHQAVKILVHDADMRVRMGRKGKEWAVEHDWSKIAERTYMAINNLQSSYEQIPQTISGSMGGQK
jgi:phosphatidylinositol alpha-1,6-mannosyltransferase